MKNSNATSHPGGFREDSTKKNARAATKQKLYPAPKREPKFIFWAQDFKGMTPRQVKRAKEEMRTEYLSDVND